MLKIYDVREARAKILRRGNPLDVELPAGIRHSINLLFGADLSAAQVVERLIDDVRARGDAALREWTAKIDGVRLDRLTVPPVDIEAALEAVDPELVAALRLAAGRIRDFHERQPLPNWTTTAMGGILGQRVTPLQRVGVYVPGGTAPLPSSLLMGVVPAQVAGVEEIVVITPPNRQGTVAPIMLAAAAVAGVSRIFLAGGAQAIGALAFGTETIPRVDKIVGPGNLFVMLAKRHVFGYVGIDGLYGPTETVVIADDTADPAWIAADLLAQAEHDVLATAILFTPSRALAEAVQVAVARQLEALSRAEIIAQSLAGQGGIVLTRDVAEAAALADEFAAEHVCLAVADPAGVAQTIKSGGGLFIGERSFEVLGDYVAGPSHTMPTSGTARFASPLNVLDFVRINSIIQLDDATSARLSPVAARLAEAEQLTAHAAAARRRVPQLRGQPADKKDGGGDA
jgi:histidinol dehydrogenase